MVEHLVFEDPEDADNSVIFGADADGIGVTVSEEKAMNSYNETFTCYFAMTRYQAIQLRDFITRIYG